MGARKFRLQMKRLQLLKLEIDAFGLWVAGLTYAEIGRRQGITAMGAYKRVWRANAWALREERLEREVARLRVAGESYRAIGKALGITVWDARGYATRANKAKRLFTN
jgi:DNA-binding CsgD family transcriptional regulator